MQFDLTCGSDIAILALYDPGAVLHLAHANSLDRWASEIEAEAAKGALIAYSYAADGEMSFRIFVDEPIDPELERRADAKAEGVLQVPTGRLVASGAEYLTSLGKHEISAEDFRPRRGAERVIPSGNYAVVAFDVERGEEAEDAAGEVPLGASRTGSAIEDVLAPLTVFLVFGSILGLGAAGCLIVFGDMTLRVVWGRIESYGLWYAGLWAAVIALWQLTPVQKAVDARGKEYDKVPGAVVQLRRLPVEEDISDRRGCAFGIGFK